MQVREKIEVSGSLFGREFQTFVDHDLAKKMLTNRADGDVVQLFADYAGREPSTETLSEITRRYSFDVATLFFIEKIYGQAKNRHVQDFYLDAVDRLTLENREASELSFLKDYFIVFVPGFRYKHIDNGGNFLRQRRLLDSAGIAYEMIDIEDVGRVDENARIIARRLQELSRLHSNIIVISVSKGGLETAIALGELVEPQNIASVKGWINVGGILKGTPVADRWAKPVMRFWIACGLFWARIKVDLKGLVTDMSYKRGKEKYQSLTIPAQIYTVNLVAASLGREQGEKTVFTAPNDRFSPLSDTITKDGVVAFEMGLDHYFKDVDLNVRMVALLRYIVNQLN